jgi:hypothetical protein
MGTRFLSAILLFVLAITGCRKDDMQRVNCDTLQQAVIAGNPDQVEIEINKILSALPAGADSEENLKILTTAISTQCKIISVPVCFNCIETNPAQSEIRISVAVSGNQKNKIIDISYSEGRKYVFAGMHD